MTLHVAGIGDIYQDGMSDIVWQDTTTGDVSIWIMDGLTRVRVEALEPANIGDPAWRVKAVADINNDGHPDLLWQHPAGWTAVSLLVGRAVVAQHLMAPFAVASGWQLSGTADFDRDGLLDVIWHNEQTGDLAWWKLDGHGYVSSGALSPANVAQPPWRVRGSADFDGDGMADIVWQHADTGQISVWLMQGTTARTWIAFQPAYFGDPAWRVVAPR